MSDRIKLVATEGRIYDENGKYMASISMTDEAVALQNDEYREEGEPWIRYRERTEQRREDEELKRFQIAKEITGAYNEKYFDNPTNVELVTKNYRDDKGREVQRIPKTHRLGTSSGHKES